MTSIISRRKFLSVMGKSTTAGISARLLSASYLLSDTLDIKRYHPDKFQKQLEERLRSAKIEITYRGNWAPSDYVEESLQRIEEEFTRLYNLRSYAPWADESDPEYQNYSHVPAEAIERFKDLKFGIRIHWGVYSMNASNPSWSLWPPKGQLGNADYGNYDQDFYQKFASGEFQKPEPGYPSLGMSNKKYIEYLKRYCTFYQTFNPKNYDPNKWAELFSGAGFQFAVLTAKHHDGFSMFDTKTWVNALKKVEEKAETTYRPVINHYSIMDTPYQKDIIQAFIQAMRAKGIAVGLYFSNPDWMDYDGRFAQGNLFRDSTYTRQNDPEGWKRFLLRHREQLNELTSNYGKIDILSLDHGLPRNAWPEFKETLRIVRRNQPEIMIRHRGIGDWGDYFSPEGWYPKSYYDVRINNKRPWTVIGSTGLHPGYSWPQDQKYPSVEKLVENLITIVSVGGNYQLGFGPSPYGTFDEGAVQLMNKIGTWLQVNGKAIYDTRAREVYREGEFIRFTRSKNNTVVYAICTEWPGEQLVLHSVRAQDNSKIFLLGSIVSLAWHQDDAGLVIEVPEQLQEPKNRPCDYAYTFKIRQKEPLLRWDD